MQLLPHNQITLEQLESYTNRNENCCVVNPCGSGKTFIMAAFIENHSDKSFVIITKQKNAAQYYQKKAKAFRGKNVLIITYNKMHSDFKQGIVEKYNADIYIIDEAHYVGAPLWYETFMYFKNKYRPLLIGFTATPQRYADRGTNQTIVTKVFENSVGNFTATQLEKTGVFSPVNIISALWNCDKIIATIETKIAELDASDTTKMWYHKKLQETLSEWKSKYSPDVIFKKYIPQYLYKSKCNRILVYCTDVATLNDNKQTVTKLLRKTFPEKKIVAYTYTYKTSEDELKSFLTEDNDADIKVLYSINKVMETIHIDDLKILIALRPSTSDRIIIQQFGRINNIKNKKDALILDMVMNMTKLGNQESIGEQRRSSQHKKSQNNPYFSTPIVTQSLSLFQAIDDALGTINCYTYSGITATLRDLCFIFRKDYNEVKEYCKTMYIEDAMELSKTKLPKNKMQETYDFTLSNEDMSLVTKHMNLYENFIENKNITDEDMAHNIYIEFCRACHEYNTKNVNIYSGTFVINRLKNKYLKELRNNIDEIRIRNNEMPLKNINIVCQEKDLAEILERTACNRTLLQVIKRRLGPRSQKIIMLRYGLTDGHEHTFIEIGKEFNVSASRIRQIEKKALQLLRNTKLAPELKWIKDTLYS